MPPSPLQKKKTSAAVGEPTRPALLKMSKLALLSGVPAATIKHYLREGLLPQPGVRTGRNMALYDATLVERVKTIKELQRKRFLPLRVIKGVLEGDVGDADAETASAIRRALEEMAPPEVRTRAQLIASGMPESELDFFCAIGAVTPSRVDGEERYVGDDLSLLQTLGTARKAGISRAMLPPSILQPYVHAIRELVRIELQMFRQGVVPRAGKDLPRLAEAATKLSEKLVVLLRRKMLLPTLEQMVEEQTHARARRAAKKPSPKADQSPTETKTKTKKKKKKKEQTR